MEILICIKQVPDDSVEIKFDEAAGVPKIDGVTPVVNAFDGYALEMATRFKEAHGGEITAVSIGTEKVKDILKNCLAVGADQAYAVIDDAFENSDSNATAYILSKAIAKIEELTGKKFDIIFCGKESTDFATGQVGSQLAEVMEMPQVTGIIALDPKDNGIETKQETEEGYKVIDVALPCVVTVNKPDYEPRYPTMRNKMAARKKEIPVLTAADIDADTQKTGSVGSFVKVIKTYAPPKRQAGVKVKEETVEETAAKVVAMMVEAKAL